MPLSNLIKAHTDFFAMAYADVKKLRKWDIVTGVDGEKWIAIKAKNRNA